jgi:PKHD-type hydroxylase
MSNYTFAPAITQEHNHPFVTWDDAFTDEELEKLKSYAKTLPIQEALVEENVTPNAKVRKTKVSWISNTDESSWIYDRLAFVARKLNAKFYKFDLYGFLEDMQFTIYEETDESHYTWHIDMSDTAVAARKLSMVLQLSDPSEYEGGELQTWTNPEPTTVDKQKGLIAAFPSYVLHRVTPVTKGTRYSLVIWVCGPSFK